VGNRQVAAISGTLYGWGVGGAKNSARAVLLFKQACASAVLGVKQEKLLGCVNLATAYRLGLGVSKDLARAEQLYAFACANLKSVHER
jgi:TPR repeat protein